MTENEIKAYGQLIIDSKDNDTIVEKLSDIKEDLIYRGVEDIVEEISRIIFWIEEEMDTAKELDLQEEVQQLRAIIDTCDEFLASEQNEIASENLTEDELIPKQIVFAKSEAENFYVNSDIKKVKYSDDIYSRIENIFELIQSGRRSSNPTIAKKLKNNKKYPNIIEYKNYQARVYTINLVDNVVCIIGIRIKKGDNPKSIMSFLTERCKKLEHSHTIEKMSEMIRNGKKEELLAESKEELANIMNILRKKTTKESKKLSKEISENENVADMKSAEIDEEKCSREKNDEELETKTLKQSQSVVPKSIMEKPVVKNKQEQQWMTRYNLAKEYYKNYGDLKILSHYIDPKTKIKLGIWICSQRSAYKTGKMSEKRIRLLEEIGMVWSIRSQNHQTEDKCEEIEILDLYPEEKVEIQDENTKDKLISQISAYLDSMDVETLYKIQKIIENFVVQIDLENELNQIYEGLLKMSPDELNDFVIQLENVELPSYKRKK